MIGDFEVKDEDLAGRIGKLETSHGVLETPSFFPVVNLLKREISIKDILSVGFNNIITNAYILKKNKIVKQDIHKELNFNSIIMTDSGAYQILEYGNIVANNKEIVEYQNEIKPDIAVILDVPTGKLEDREEAKMTVDETLRRAKDVEDIIDVENIIWTHPIQGGRFLDLLQYSASEANKREKYKMLALGSPTVLMERYDYDTLIDMIFTVRTSISRGKPLHLFGGGLPHLIPFAVALGVDSFDSASYILYARDNRYITRSRTFRLEDIDSFPCSCPVCSKYTPEELLEMDDNERVRLLAIHNLYKILEEIRETKIAIKEGRLFEYIQEKAFSHPSVYSAFKKLLKYAEYLEKYDPRVKGEIKGLFLFNEDSIKRPEIIRHYTYLDSIKPLHDKAIIICGDKLTQPFISDPLISKIVRENYMSADIYVAYPFYGLIPILISESYPLSQFEIPKILSESVIKISSDKANSVLKSKYKKIDLIECENSMLHIMPI